MELIHRYYLLHIEQRNPHLLDSSRHLWFWEYRKISLTLTYKHLGCYNRIFRSNNNYEKTKMLNCIAQMYRYIF